MHVGWILRIETDKKRSAQGFGAGKRVRHSPAGSQSTAVFHRKRSLGCKLSDPSLFELFRQHRLPAKWYRNLWVRTIFVQWKCVVIVSYQLEIMEFNAEKTFIGKFLIGSICLVRIWGIIFYIKKTIEYKIFVIR